MARRGGEAKAEASCSEVAVAADTAARQGTAIESLVLFCTIFIEVASMPVDSCM